MRFLELSRLDKALNVQHKLTIDKLHRAAIDHAYDYAIRNNYDLFVSYKNKDYVYVIMFDNN